MSSQIKSGVVLDFFANHMSGIATLLLKVNGKRVAIPCENGPTCRALDQMYPGFIVPGHNVDVGVIRGERLRYSMTDYGVLEALDFPE